LIRGKTLNTETENLNLGQLPEVDGVDETGRAGAAAFKRAFVEPEVSFPVDVLESTTFFQLADSGPINP
jgi:hypothetical protein